MKDRRFLFTYGNVSTFADRLRIGSHDDLGRFHLVLHAGDPADEDSSQAPVSIDLPKKNRAAYERAALAFNAILDEHDRQEASKSDRRCARLRSRACTTAIHTEH